MSIKQTLLSASLIASLLTLGSCTASTNSEAVDPVAVNAQPAPAGATAPTAADPATTPANLPLVQVHKSAYCGCCGAWVDHMRESGFQVEVNETEELEPIRQRLGVPYAKGSCHTAEVDGYVVEGHVPAEDVKRLLSQRPSARGLVLPGMPIGSPGMESPDGRIQPYVVELVASDGTTQPYAQHP